MPGISTKTKTLNTILLIVINYGKISTYWIKCPALRLKDVSVQRQIILPVFMGYGIQMKINLNLSEINLSNYWYKNYKCLLIQVLGMSSYVVTKGTGYKIGARILID